MFSFFISQLLAKAIPVRGAIFREARLRKLKRAFCFSCPLTSRYVIYRQPVSVKIVSQRTPFVHRKNPFNTLH